MAVEDDPDLDEFDHPNLQLSFEMHLAQAEIKADTRGISEIEENTRNLEPLLQGVQEHQRELVRILRDDG